MAQDIFRAELGLGIDEGISFLSQDGLPGLTTETDDAIVGSYSSDQLTGIQYRKKTAGSGTNKWIKILDSDDSVGGSSSWREPVIVKDDTIYANLVAAEAAVNTGTIQVTLSANDRILFTGITGSPKDVFIITGTPGAGATLTIDTQGLTDGDTLYVLEGTDAGKQFTYNLSGDTWIFVNQDDQTELGFVRTFIGKGASGSETPSYGSPTYILNGDSLETAISKLDIQIDTNVTSIGTNTTNIGINTTNISNLITSFGSQVDASGSWVGFTGTNFLDASTSNTSALILLDTEISTVSTNISNLQIEVDNIETTLGPVIDANGNYVAHTTSNYIDGNTTITQDLLDLDAQIFTNEGNISTNSTSISNLQTEVDNIETSLGGMVDVNGNYVAHVGTNYIDGNTSVTEDLTDLDSQVGTNATDISNLQADNGDEANIRAFIGKGAAGSETPVYTSAEIVTQNTDLEAAIGELDAFVDKNRKEISLLNQAVPTLTTIASELVDEVKAIKYFVWIQEVSSGDANAIEVYVTHNGTASSDATGANETAYAKVRVGLIGGVEFNATVSGTGASQLVNLQIKANNNIDIYLTRILVV